jgi:hypothetical protein
MKHWGAARTALVAAEESFEELGASLWVKLARAELSRIGGRAAGQGLSETETKVWRSSSRAGSATSRLPRRCS